MRLKVRFARGLALGFLLSLPIPKAGAQDAAMTSSAFRLRIEKAADSPWPANVGVVSVSPCLVAPRSFTVFTSDGKPVASQMMWSAVGEMSRIRFDTSSGQTLYYICFDNNLPSAPANWRPEAGVQEETRPCRDQPIDTRAQVSQLISVAGPAYGRGYVPNVFSGLNPFGPSTYYIATFIGWFRVNEPGAYSFATASDDASTLQVDGRPVTEWLGRHGASDGRQGEHSGEIQLKAGVHRLDYLQVQMAGDSAAVAAWKAPGQDRFNVMPESAFVPVAHFRTAGFNCGPGVPEQLYFEWSATEHFAIADVTPVRMRFHVADASQNRTYRWRFDDGDSDTGMNPQHYFPEPGLRQVTLEAWAGDVCVATNSTRVRVAPNWTQADWGREDVYNRARRDFLHRDLKLMPARDVAEVINLADAWDDREFFTRVGEVMISREDEFNTPAYCVTFYKLAMDFQHQGDRGDALAEKAFRLTLAPQRSVASIADKVKLRFADLLIHYSGNWDEAEQMLQSISAGRLAGDERRFWVLLQGDLLLARGKVEEARKQYRSAGSVTGAGQFDSRSAARLESASILIDRGQLDDAQAALAQSRMEQPLQRMSLDSGLLNIELYLKRNEFQRAFLNCQALKSIASGDPRESELIYALAESGFALNKTNEAQAALRQLLKEFPYSESAARAKDQWARR